MRRNRKTVQTADTTCTNDEAAGSARAAGRHIAIFLSGVDVGGVQRTMLTLAHALAQRGHRIDLVLSNAQGPFRALVPEDIRLIDLENWWLRLPLIRRRKRSRVLASPPLIARYLREEQPDLLLSASHYVNIAALIGRRLAGLDAPLVISQRTHLTRAIANGPMPGVSRPLLGPMVRRFYPWADAVVAVSDGVADDTAEVSRLPRSTIRTIYNPADTLDIARQAQLPVDHPWFQPGGPPMILAVGRLAAQKDFPTLLRAFAQVREGRDARLVILGEGRQRPMLEALVDQLGLAHSVDFPGYEQNPFRFMARATVFVLSSLYEGLPGALIQALACGCPVVSTDCPSGPHEILEGGRYGALVTVGDVNGMAEAMKQVLASPPDPQRQRARAEFFSVDTCADQYLELLFALAARGTKNADSVAE